MTATSDIQTRIFAACGAVAMTLALLVSSFANPNATTVAGLLA